MLTGGDIEPGVHECPCADHALPEDAGRHDGEVDDGRRLTVALASVEYEEVAT